MVSISEVGVLLGGIAALIGVLWTVVTGLRNSKDLKHLEKVVQPLYEEIRGQRSDNLEVRNRQTDILGQQKKQELSLLDRQTSADQELRRQELEQRQRELQWSQAREGAKALGWFIKYLQEGDDENEYDEYE